MYPTLNLRQKSLPNNMAQNFFVPQNGGKMFFAPSMGSGGILPQKILYVVFSDWLYMHL